MSPTTKNNILPVPAVAKQIMVSALHDYFTDTLMPEIANMLPGIMPELRYDQQLMLPKDKEITYDMCIVVNWAAGLNQQDFIGVAVNPGGSGELSVTIAMYNNFVTEIKQHFGVVDDIMREIVAHFTTGTGATYMKQSLNIFLSLYLKDYKEDPNRSVYARVCGEHMAKLLTTETAAQDKSVYEMSGCKKEDYAMAVLGTSEGIGAYELTLKVPASARGAQVDATLKTCITAEPIKMTKVEAPANVAGWQESVAPVTMTWTEHTHLPENKAEEDVRPENGEASPIVRSKMTSFHHNLAFTNILALVQATLCTVPGSSCHVAATVRKFKSGIDGGPVSKAHSGHVLNFNYLGAYVAVLQYRSDCYTAMADATYYPGTISLPGTNFSKRVESDAEIEDFFSQHMDLTMVRVPSYLYNASYVIG